MTASVLEGDEHILEPIVADLAVANCFLKMEPTRNSPALVV